jgi:hypothetical protein
MTQQQTEWDSLMTAVDDAYASYRRIVIDPPSERRSPVQLDARQQLAVNHLIIAEQNLANHRQRHNGRVGGAESTHVA